MPLPLVEDDRPLEARVLARPDPVARLTVALAGVGVTVALDATGSAAPLAPLVAPLVISITCLTNPQ